MNTNYYFLPIVWTTCGGNNMLDVIRTGKGITTQNVSPKKAREVARQKEVEINGEVFSVERLIANRKPMTQIVVQPYNQARNFIAFTNWPCNNEGGY